MTKAKSAAARAGRTVQAGPWRPEPGGAVSAAAGAFRLEVRPPAPGGYARYLVLRDELPGHSGSRRGGRALLTSGSEDTVPAAMHAAERAAARLMPDGD